MKITNQLLTLFVAQQGLSASAFTPAFVNTNVVASKNTALNYRVNESEQFQREKLLTPPSNDLEELKDMANVFKNKNVATAPAALETQQQHQPPYTEPEIGGSRKFDLAGAKKARGPRNTGAVRGAFKSLAGSRSIKSIQGGNCLKTWNIINDNIERVSIMLNNEGVPLSASVEVW